MCYHKVMYMGSPVTLAQLHHSNSRMGAVVRHCVPSSCGPDPVHVHGQLCQHLAQRIPDGRCVHAQPLARLAAHGSNALRTEHPTWFEAERPVRFLDGVDIAKRPRQRERTDGLCGVLTSKWWHPQRRPSSDATFVVRGSRRMVEEGPEVRSQSSMSWQR